MTRVSQGRSCEVSYAYTVGRLSEAEVLLLHVCVEETAEVCREIRTLRDTRLLTKVVLADLRKKRRLVSMAGWRDGAHGQEQHDAP